MAKDKKTSSQVRARIRWGIVGIFVMLIASLGYAAPRYTNKVINTINSSFALEIPKIKSGFSLGLDLQGGASLIYEADTSQIPLDERGAAVEGVRDVIERRVNGIGVSEPEVRTTKVADTYRVNVELPGIDDVSTAISMIGETPILEFKEQNLEPPRELAEEEQEQIDEYNEGAEDRINEALKKLDEESSFEDVVSEYSEDQLSKNNDGFLGTVGLSDPFPELYAWAQGAKDGEVSDTYIESAQGYNIVRRGAEQEGDVQITASHILICYLGARDCGDPAFNGKQGALEKAQEIFEQANASNFADLAREHSSDTVSGQDGGDLGTFGRGQMIPAFEEALFSSNVNEIIGPVETEFGYHVIFKREEEKSKSYDISRILVTTQSERDVLPPQDGWKSTGLSGSHLERAEVVSDPNTGALQVSLLFDGEGKDLFADITERHVGEPIAIFLDGEAISIPTVQTPIRDGRAVITGTYTIQEAQLLVQRLNAGALPVPVELVSQQTVGATLGIETLETSVKAGAVAIVLVMVFMVLYYRLPGVISVISLTVYISLTVALFKLIGVTLTLAGIAGFILSVGMAVDANVLIFERLKEELKKGKSLRVSVEEGFVRAWTSIRDGNVSTLITCALLIFFGSSFVQGFAMTLSIGVLISMFTAIVVTRVMLRFVTPWFGRYGNKLFPGAAGKKTE